jgi:hypothetical protein
MRDHGDRYSLIADGKFFLFNKDDGQLLFECEIGPPFVHPVLYKNAFIIPQGEFLWGSTFIWKSTRIDVPVREITHIYLVDKQLGVLDAHGHKYTFPLPQ